MTKLIRGQLLLTKRLTESVVTLGSFDGLHKGHQQLLKALHLESRRLGVPSVLVTFEPPPQRYFSNQPDFPRLMYWREKWLTVQKYDIDYMVCLHFTQPLAQMMAKDFVTNILLKQLGMKGVIVGKDFKFGAHRSGNVELLRQLGKQYHFFVNEQPFLKMEENRVSSTLIRKALHAGEISKANQLLGTAYFLTGKVVHGDQRGSQLLGFPTANIDLRRKPVPLSGIFVVKVMGLTDKALPGVASLGVRPMFDGVERWLEVHIIDFNEQIYGKQIQVQFLHKLRDETCFPTIKQLIMQMQLDVHAAKIFLGGIDL